MKVVCLALLFVQCSCSKSDDLRIPSVYELNSSGGSISSVGANNGLLSIGNIATIFQSNIDTAGGYKDSGDEYHGDDNKYNEKNGNIGQLNIGNIANIAQSNIGSQGGIGNLATILQSNIGGSQGSSGNIGNIANINQINIGAILGLLNILSQNNSNNYYIDEDRYVYRPCEFYDTYCIKKFFADHSKCKIAYGPVPDPKYRVQSSTNIPRLNFSVVAHDVLYSGLNGRIQEFYVNKKTDNLVLEVEFRNVIFFSANAYFKFQRVGREPIVTNDFLYLIYDSYVTTTIIPFKKELELEKSETTSYINDPKFLAGPNAFNYPDPAIQLAPLGILSDVGANAQEAQVTEAPFHAATFIQDSICDFGLKVL